MLPQKYDGGAYIDSPTDQHFLCFVSVNVNHPVLVLLLFHDAEAFAFNSCSFLGEWLNHLDKKEEHSKANHIHIEQTFIVVQRGTLPPSPAAMAKKEANSYIHSQEGEAFPCATRIKFDKQKHSGGQNEGVLVFFDFFR